MARNVGGVLTFTNKAAGKMHERLYELSARPLRQWRERREACRERHDGTSAGRAHTPGDALHLLCCRANGALHARRGRFLARAPSEAGPSCGARRSFCPSRDQVNKWASEGSSWTSLSAVSGGYVFRRRDRGLSSTEGKRLVFFDSNAAMDPYGPMVLPRQRTGTLPPHSATAIQRRREPPAIAERKPPHPATVIQKRRASSFAAAEQRPPHPATVSQTRAATRVRLPSTRSVQRMEGTPPSVKPSSADRVKALTSNRSGLGSRHHEGEVGAAFEAVVGELDQAENQKIATGDFVCVAPSSPYYRKTFDLLGLPNEKAAQFLDTPNKKKLTGRETFELSFRDHVTRNVDFVIIDVTFLDRRLFEACRGIAAETGTLNRVFFCVKAEGGEFVFWREDRSASPTTHL